jgi:hypothetical protein
MLTMALIGVMLVVRAGPACAGMLQPVPLVAQAGVDTNKACHGMAGEHERSEVGDHKNVQATCAAACVAVPPVARSPQALMAMPSAEPNAGRLVMAGMNLAPIPPLLEREPLVSHTDIALEELT